MGLYNLSVKQNQNCSLAHSFHPLEISHIAPRGCAGLRLLQSNLILLISSHSGLLAAASSSAFLAPPFPPSTQFLFCSSHLPLRGLRAVLLSCFFFSFSLNILRDLYTVQRYMFHWGIPTWGLNPTIWRFCRGFFLSFVLSEIRYYRCEFMNIKYRWPLLYVNTCSKKLAVS